MLLGSDGQPLNQSLSRLTGVPVGPLDPMAGKPIEIEPGRNAPREPEKTLTVSADSRDPSFASLLSAGEAYRPTVMESAKMSPEVCCPKCGQICTGFKHTVPEFKIPDLPEELVRHLFISNTCGCAVTQEWAGAINAELLHRQGGGEPRQVVEMTDGQRKSLYARLEKRLFELMEKYEQCEVKDSPAAQRINTVMTTLTGLMTTVSEPMRDLSIYKQSQEFIKQQQHLNATVKLDKKEFDYNPATKLPDLQKAAAKAGKADDVFKKYANYVGKQPVNASNAADKGVPSASRLIAALNILRGDDWLGVVAGAFPLLLTNSERLARREAIVHSVYEYAKDRDETKLTQEVHDFLYFVAYGRAVPLVKGGLTGVESINTDKAKAVPAQPVVRAVPGFTPDGTAAVPAPPVNPAEFHKQFERKKRRVRKVDHPPET